MFDLLPYHEEWIKEIDAHLAGQYTESNLACFMDRQRVLPLIQAARDLIEEDLRLHQVRGVLLPPGNSVKAHSHLSMRVVLYMLHHSPSMLAFQYESFHTIEGMAVDIARGREHWVTENTSNEPRRTIAVMFESIG